MTGRTARSSKAIIRQRYRPFVDVGITGRLRCRDLWRAQCHPRENSAASGLTTAALLAACSALHRGRHLEVTTVCDRSDPVIRQALR
jgi:hypothetical protein